MGFQGLWHSGNGTCCLDLRCLIYEIICKRVVWFQILIRQWMELIILQEDVKKREEFHTKSDCQSRHVRGFVSNWHFPSLTQKCKSIDSNEGKIWATSALHACTMTCKDKIMRVCKYISMHVSWGRVFFCGWLWLSGASSFEKTRFEERSGNSSNIMLL